MTGPSISQSCPHGRGLDCRQCWPEPSANIHPLIAAALAPLTPPPCRHSQCRPVADGMKCMDCGVFIEDQRTATLYPPT